MNNLIDHNELEAVLQECGSNWSSSQAHGLLCGRLSVLGTDGAVMWLDQVLEGQDENNASREECGQLLDKLFQSTWQNLAERQSEFELLLPEDDEDAARKAAA